MPNLASILKDEIRRLARREIRSQVAVTKRLVAQHRRDIAQLKRQMKRLSNQVVFLEAQEKRRVSKPISEAPSGQVRFSPRWLKAHREKLGLSAADYGRLVGVSGLTIYNWEAGKAKPRREKVAALAAMRGFRKREAMKRLEMMAG
jgi:DNA-binding transcriptional regulator YiaG